MFCVKFCVSVKIPSALCCRRDFFCPIKSLILKEMKLVKSLSPFILILIIGLISFRFLFFISYIKGQKSEFRKQLISENNNKVIEVKFSKDDIYINKNGCEWKEKNKELVINGIFHEVIAIKEINDFFVVSLIEDKAENSLFKKFFCMHKGIHKDFSELIKLLINLTYLESNSDIVFNNIALKNQFVTSEFHFFDSQFYLKLIKPPQA